MSTDTFPNDKMAFADVLREMDIDFIVLGEYGITVEDAAKLIHKDHFIFLDVRTRKKESILPFHLRFTSPSMSCRIAWGNCRAINSS